MRRPGPVGRLNLGAGTWELLWGTVHRILVVNLGMAAGNLPLLAALAVVDDPRRSPVFFGALALGVGPSLAAAVGYLDGAERHGTDAVADLVRRYRRRLLPAAGLWAAGTAALGVLAVDVAFVHARPAAAFLVPLLAVLTLLVASAAVLAMALLHLRPRLAPAAVARAAVYLAVRRWWLGLLNLVVLAAAALAVGQAPLLGLATLPGCAVIVVRANSAAAAAAVLGEPEGE